MTNTAHAGWRSRRNGHRRGMMSIALVVWVAVAVLGNTGCSLDDLLKSDQLPPGITDPTITHTPAGAMAAYQGTIALFAQAFGGGSDGALANAALLTDELQMGRTLGSLEDFDLVDGRSLQSAGSGTYSYLQKVRGQASQAIGLLSTYVPESPAFVSHLYALAGYSELFLAELYCSGIPLSTLDFNGDYTLRPGSSTAQVFQHAAALFDTALTLSGDSTRFIALSTLGKARALLALGEYTAAANAVATVPDTFRYEVKYVTGLTGNTARNIFLVLNQLLWDWRVADREGENGLDYISSGDPRTGVTVQGVNSHGFSIYLPTKYQMDGWSPIVLASGIEARLIEAEAVLQAGDDVTWLAKLNALRTDGSYDVTPATPPDTLWHAGTGGIPGLAPLTDPGTATARVDLLFRERAFWLFLTGHRQGDLRRLIRQYGRLPGDLYPIGGYPDGVRVYGGDLTFPVPREEEITNPLFTGCDSRGA